MSMTLNELKSQLWEYKSEEIFRSHSHSAKLIHCVISKIKVAVNFFVIKFIHELDQGCPTCRPLNIFMRPTAYSNFLVIFS